MSRRAARRREAIECQLLHGTATVRQLARALRRPQLFVWDDLTAMEKAGAVITEWVQRPGWPDGAKVAAYRLPTLADHDARDAEQAEHDALLAATEQRLRAALQARAEQVRLDNGSTP